MALHVVLEGSAHNRLLVALSISVLVHASLIFGFVVRSPSGAPGASPALVARLEMGEPVPTGESQVAASEDRPRVAAQQHPPAPESAAVDIAAPAQPSGEPVPAATGIGEESEPSALPEVEMPVPDELTWYPARQLDVLPIAQVEVEARYPEGAAADDIGGEVTLLLLVDELGQVRERSVVEADPPGVFEEAALAAFGDVQFAPAMKNGRRVRSRVLVTLTFHPQRASEPEEPATDPPPAQ